MSVGGYEKKGGDKLRCVGRVWVRVHCGINSKRKREEGISSRKRTLWLRKGASATQ